MSIPFWCDSLGVMNILQSLMPVWARNTFSYRLSFRAGESRDSSSYSHLSADEFNLLSASIQSFYCSEQRKYMT